ncbi:PKD domain-containing protein [Halovenus salina]|uniref:PKD domain-containing protein n=1 Tax=Halovenus salina TaxID=1510225 RepID=A0ABD5W764_9EURY
MSSGNHTGHAGVSRATLLFLLVAVVIVAVGVVATGVTAAQSSDDSPPELGGGEKINTTAVEVTIVDDSGILMSSVDTDDFLLSDGELSHITRLPDGTSASVTLVLAEPIPVEELTVGIASDSDISNVNGTQIQTGGDAQTVTISGMDGVPPRVLGTDTGDAIGSPAELEFRFDERLSDITVEVTGPENTTLGIDDFDNPVSNRYVARYTPPESGEYTVSLASVTDRAGNTRNTTLARQIRADRTQPEAVIGIDFGASSGVNITFDASQSAGNELTYQWDFGDGATATGEQVSHEFTPAEHTISLTVRNGFGNTDQDTVDLNLTGGLDSETDVDRDNETAPVVLVNRDGSENAQSSLVSVTGALAREQIKIGTISDSETPLVTRNAVSLDRLAVTPTVDSSFSLALSGLGTGEITDAATGGAVEIGGFSVLTDIEENEVSTAEFVFSIDAQRLDVLGTAPEDVVLRRESGGEWTTRNTTVLADRGEQYQFVAETPGFSRFAVVATNATTAPGESEPDGGENETDETNRTAAFEVTDAAVDPVEIAPGESVEITAQVENTGNAAGSFRAGLQQDGAVVETRETAVEPGESATVQFTRTLSESGTVPFAVNDTTAGDVTVLEPEDNGSSTNTTPGDELNVNESAFTVANVTINESSIGTGDSVRVEGDVVNEGDEQADYIAELEVDGEVVDTFDVPAVHGGTDIPVTFTQRFNESGTYNISISGTASESQLEVGGGGGLFSFLGFLPLGLVQTGQRSSAFRWPLSISC